jgi:predicted membrane-bound spermidine synthase
MRRIARALPHAVVFATSMGVMIVELVASRLVAKYLGSSLYTWTSVIGIVLGGISLGNWLGGKLADKFTPRRIIPLLLLACSILTFLIVGLDLAVGRITRTLGVEAFTMSILVRSVLLIVALFFLPSTALGTISPVMAKYALEQANGVGKTVGGIYAAGSLGSIAGTFLAGYVLIPLLGLTMNILLVGILLALLSLAMGGRRIFAGAWVVVLIALAATRAPDALARALMDEQGTGKRLVFAGDSAYSYIQVTDRETQAGVERDLRLDALIHNKHDPANLDALLYEYERIYEALTREIAPSSTLTLGGGAFTLPGYLARHYPKGRHVVVEIDPAVVDTAFRFFDLPRQTSIEIVRDDARAYVDRAQAGKKFDIIYCDAFNAFSVPSHLTTREFTEKVAAILAPGGAYLVNCIDIFDSGLFLNAFTNTLRAVFPEVSVYATRGSMGGSRSTFVIAAGARELGGETLRGPDGSEVGARIPPERMAALRERNGGTVLTDDHAPVETLTAPVFLGSVK